MHEAALVQAAISGDRAALGDLIIAHQDRIRRYVQQQTEYADDVDDIMADTWERVIRGISAYEPRGWPFQAWVYTIAQARIVDNYRKKVVRRRVLAPLDDALLFAAPVSIRLDPYDVAALRQAFERIKPIHQRVIRLRYGDELDWLEIGQRLNLSANAAKTLRVRALTALRRHLDGYDY